MSMDNGSRDSREGSRGGRILPALAQMVWPVFFYELVTVGLYMVTKKSLGRPGTMCLAAALSSAVFLCLKRMRRERYGIDCAYAGQRRGHIVARIAAIAILALVTSALVNIIMNVTGIAGLSKQYADFSKEFFSVPISLQILTTVILVPLAEELIFRGLAYERMRNLAGVLPAVFASALLFGVSHGNISQGIYAFLMGIPLALTYEKEGLSGALLFHAFCNLTSVFSVLLLNR